MTRPPPTTLSHGRYRLTGLLGQGGMASVYRCYDQVLDVDKAIKLLDPSRAAHGRSRARFLNEARAMAALHHPGIVAVHDVVDEGEHVYLVMELVRGGSLYDRLHRAGPIPSRQAASVMAKVLRAVQLAHDHGIIHRDIKPHNILLDVTGEPKLTDFGIARRDGSSHTREGSKVGTAEYMAPEQREDATVVDARSDVFGAGATLYALAANRAPVDLHDPATHSVRFEGMDWDLAEVIIRATRRDPFLRYPTALHMADALDEIAESLPAVPADAPPLADPDHLGTQPSMTPVHVEEAFVLGRSRLAPEAPPSRPWAVVAGVALAALAVSLVVGGLLYRVGVQGQGSRQVGVAVPIGPAEVGRVVVEPSRDTAVEAVAASEAPAAAPEVAAAAPAAAPASGPGTLKVSSRPWSEVFIDGAGVGNTAWEGEVAAGRRQVRLVRPDGAEYVQTVSVGRGEQVAICWDFTVESTCF